MKIIKIEFKEKTSQGIYCDITYKIMFCKIKKRECFLKVFPDGIYSSFPKWSDTGREVSNYDNLQKQMIRAYERTLNN